MTLESDAVAGATIELLEARLRRIAYLLTGATEWTGSPITPEKPASHDETISRRLARLGRELEKLSRNVPAVRDVIQLRMYQSCVVYTDAHARPHCFGCIQLQNLTYPNLSTMLTTITQSRRPLPRPLPNTAAARDPRRPVNTYPRLHRPLLRNRLP